MNVLVTGGAGYIGSHTCKALAQAGITPVVYDDLSAGHEWSVKWGPLVIGDLGDRTLLQLTIRKYDIQAVFHLAGRVYVGESIVNPRMYYQNNLVGSLSLLDAMLDTGRAVSSFHPRAPRTASRRRRYSTRRIVRSRSIPMVRRN
jgi:UDP-arabinose 4-epimerase